MIDGHPEKEEQMRATRVLTALVTSVGLVVGLGVAVPASAASGESLREARSPRAAQVDLRLESAPHIGGWCRVSVAVRTDKGRLGKAAVVVQKRRNAKQRWRTVKTVTAKKNRRVTTKARAYRGLSFRAVHAATGRVERAVSESVRCKPQKLQPGTRTPAVKKLQKSLRKKGYRPASRSGTFDSDTGHAVMAFQKHTKRKRTGQVGATLYRTIRNAKRAKAPKWCADASRICIDLSKQTAYLTGKNKKRFVIPVSTGNDQWFYTPSGQRDFANTPLGVYKVYFKRPGRTDGPLGTYYWFSAFLRGWGVHGSNSVPAHPASHGCVRVPRSIERWVYANLPIGAQVHVHR